MYKLRNLRFPKPHPSKAPRLLSGPARPFSGLTPMEEESFIGNRLYYPAHLDDVFQDRYRTLLKLGYGGSSTVWLCKDKTDDSYKVLKIGICKNAESQELKVLRHLQQKGISHNGQYYVRRSCDSFQVAGVNGRHQCFVYEPLGISLFEYVNRRAGRRLNLNEVKWATSYLLTAIDYLHTCGVIHTDIKLDNIQTTLPDDEKLILDKLVQAEHETPSPSRQINTSWAIYTSRVLQYDDVLTFPILGDLGMGVFGQTTYTGLIQPIPYRAPEVILRAEWSTAVDIWNMGVLIWEMLFAEYLFGDKDETECLEKMIVYLGPVPVNLLHRGKATSDFLTDTGEWRRGKIQPISMYERLEGTANLDLFLEFINLMLNWLPEKRATAAELLKHPWLQQ